MSEDDQVFWWFLSASVAKLSWLSWVFLGLMVSESPSDWNCQSQACWEVGSSKVKSFFSFFSFLPFLSTSFLSLFPSSFLFSLVSTDIYWVPVMSMSVLSGSEIVVSGLIYFIFFLNLQLMVADRTWTGCRVMSEWRQVETILGKNNGTQGVSPFV